MRVTLIWSLAAVSMLAITGCNKAESPAKVDSDVSKAAATAAENDVKANEQAANDVAKAQDKADAKTAEAAADTEVAQAEGDNKIALAKCEALSADAQKACKDQANARLDQAKAHAKAMKSDRG